MPKKLAYDTERKAFPSRLLKADAETGVVDAIVSVMGIVDSMDDVIVNGAYAKTISESAHKRVRVLDHHNSYSVMDAVAKCLALREIERDELPADLLAEYPEASGALVATMQFMLNDPNSRAVYDRLQAGVIDEWSVGFNSVKMDFGDVLWRGEKRYVRFIREIRLWEFSAVLWGANPATMTTAIKSADETRQILAQWIGEEKAGRVLSEKNAARIQNAVSALVDVLNEAGVLEPAEADAEDAKSVPVEPEIVSEKEAEPPKALTSQRERLLKLLQLTNSI
jgi:HK97 family phage prohead protease